MGFDVSNPGPESMGGRVHRRVLIPLVTGLLSYFPSDLRGQGATYPCDDPCEDSDKTGRQQGLNPFEGGPRCPRSSSEADRVQDQRQQVEPRAQCACTTGESRQLSPEKDFSELL